jgi:ArsR family transcriptional regulator, lead/cadmium/zinc/bismuth-responsive transcriptional repressor
VAPAYDVGMIGDQGQGALKAPPVSAGEAGRVAELFHLLGDQTRTDVLCALLAAGEMPLPDLAAAVSVSETKASDALRPLRGAGVVRSRRVGAAVHYSLQDERVRKLLELARSAQPQDRPEMPETRPRLFARDSRQAVTTSRSSRL